MFFKYKKKHNHKYKNNRDAYVFYSTSDKAENKDKHISSGNVWKKIKIITKNSKIHKNIFPHLIRHTSASFDGLVLPITLFCEKYGWSKDSPEVERYCEPSEEMKIDFLLKKAGVNPEEVNMCPRCNETNTLNSERCKKCNTILGKELVLHLENKLHQQDNLITKLTKQNDLIIKLEEKIKDITKDTSDKLDKISKSTKYIFYMSNLNVKIRYNKFITKNPKHTKKQMREYLNKDFLEFQDSKEYQLQLNLLEHLLIII